MGTKMRRSDDDHLALDDDSPVVMPVQMAVQIIKGGDVELWKWFRQTIDYDHCTYFIVKNKAGHVGIELMNDGQTMVLVPANPILPNALMWLAWIMHHDINTPNIHIDTWVSLMAANHPTI